MSLEIKIEKLFDDLLKSLSATTLVSFELDQSLWKFIQRPNFAISAVLMYID